MVLLERERELRGSFLHPNKYEMSVLTGDICPSFPASPPPACSARIGILQCRERASERASNSAIHKFTLPLLFFKCEHSPPGHVCKSQSNAECTAIVVLGFHFLRDCFLPPPRSFFCRSQSCVSLAQSIKESIPSCGRLVVKIRRLDRIKPAAATFTEAERVANWTRGEEEEDIGRLPLQSIQVCEFSFMYYGHFGGCALD